MNKESEVNYLWVFIIAVLALEAIFYSAGNFKLEERIQLEEERDIKLAATLEEITVSARAVSLYNISKNKKIYGKNDEAPMPIASLVKIMTVVVGLNSYGTEKVLSVSPEAIHQTGDFGLFAGEKWRVYELAKLTLISSANDGAYTLWENDQGNFLKEMNSKAKKIGMEHASFLNFTGLDINFDTAGAIASASDVNTLAIYGFRAYPEVFFSATLPELNLQSESGVIHNFKNTNPMVEKIPTLLFSKTGYTEIAGGNLTIIFTDKRGDEIVITVLGSTFLGRFSDMEKIVNVLYTR